MCCYVCCVSRKVLFCSETLKIKFLRMILGVASCGLRMPLVLLPRSQQVFKNLNENH